MPCLDEDKLNVDFQHDGVPPWMNNEVTIFLSRQCLCDDSAEGGSTSWPPEIEHILNSHRVWGREETFWIVLYNGVHSMFVQLLLSFQYIFVIAHSICNHPVFLNCSVSQKQTYHNKNVTSRKKSWRNQLILRFLQKLFINEFWGIDRKHKK